MNRQKTPVLAMTIMIAAMLLAAANTANAENTYWISPTGDWFDPANWQYKVPESGDHAYINNGGTALITGGSATAKILYVAFSQSGLGSNIEQNGGTLDIGGLEVGFRAPGTYNISGAAHLIATLLRLGGDTGGIGICNQTGGTISATQLKIGNYSVGTFSQSGGTNTVGGTLLLGEKNDGSGTYIISGGTLSAREIQVSQFGTGRFEINNSAASITFSENLFFGTDSTFTAVPGSTIHMPGASVDNRNTDPADLSGLKNLTLIFEGGGAAGLKTFEVAGQDIGGVAAGFNVNFALDSLILGGTDTGHIQLVDAVDNMTGTEALYVKHLVLNSGSYLDLNGLNLYCQTFYNNGGTIEANGGQLVLVREPFVLTGLEITGPDEVPEGSSAQYTATASYDDGYTMDVTSLTTWSVDPDTFASIDGNGLLTVGSVYPAEDVTIYGEYSEGGVTIVADKIVSCLPVVTEYHVDGVDGDDINDGLSRATAFATIQRGIDAAGDGDTVLVWPAAYTEAIDFLGKAITVTGADDAAVLDVPNDFAVLFYYGEGPDSVLKNFIIENSFMAVFIAGSSPTIQNLTVVDNKYGVEAYAGSEPDISNCILWNNIESDLFQCEARYSCVEDGSEGQGNIDVDPLFVDLAGGDYHLLSERGRYMPQYDLWVLDDVTSPCVDGGDPSTDASAEPRPNGGRVNMGAYGGTAYASLHETSGCPDLNGDGIVNFPDLAILADNWLRPIP